MIRAYGLEFTGQKQNTLDDFKKEVDGLSDKEYRDIMNKSAERGMTINAGSLKEFKEKELEDFYRDYEEKRRGGLCNSFEDYFLKNYKELLK